MTKKLRCKNAMKILLSVFLYMQVVFLWAAIILAFGLTYIASDLAQELGGGILIIIFVFTYICTFTAQAIVANRESSSVKKPLKMLMCAIIAVLINTFAYNAGWIYISDFSREKWDNNEILRIHMIDDFEEKYQIIGKSEQEVKDILGKPAYVEDRNVGGLNRKLVSYYVGMNTIDPYMYDIILENGVVIQTEVNEH